MKSTLLFLLSCGALAAQTCSFSSPSSGATITGSSLTVLATPASAPTVVKMRYLLDGKYYHGMTGYISRDMNPISSLDNAWSAPFAVTNYPLLNADGPRTLTAIMYDGFDNVVGSNPCATVTFSVRNWGASNTGWDTTLTSGVGTVRAATFDGTCSLCSLYIDGVAQGANPSFPTMLSFQPFGAGCVTYSGGSFSGGGFSCPNFDTTRYVNGTHEFRVVQSGSSFANSHFGSDPVVFQPTFTSGNVSGNNITFTAHMLHSQQPFCLSTTGTLPAPLNAGTCWFGQTNGTWPSGTITAHSVSAGVLSVTTSAANGTVTGTTPVYLVGTNGCDGLYTVVTGGNPFTVTAPASCTAPGAVGFGEELYVNPGFTIYGDANTISVSATPGGSPITLTNGGSGTHTLGYRVKETFWYDNGGRLTIKSAPVMGGATQLVTFSNGSAPMEYHSPNWEYHGYPGKTGDTLCGLVYNTDLSTTNPGCTAAVYNVVPDGLATGVITVASNGAITYTSTTGWAKVTVDCPATTCNSSANALPTRTYYVQNQSGSHTFFPTWAHDGSTPQNYVAGKSFMSTQMWHLSAINPNNNTQYAGVGSFMARNNINTQNAAGINARFADPTITNCSALQGGQKAADDANAGVYTQYGIASEYGFYIESGDGINNTVGPALFASLLNNTHVTGDGFDRQNCLQGALTYMSGLGHVFRISSSDEVDPEVGGSNPAPNGTLGSSDFASVTWTGGVATATSKIAVRRAWVQSTGQGSAVLFTGATTNTCLNGWHLVTNPTSQNSTAPTGPTGYSFNTTCAGSGNASADNGLLTVHYMWSPLGCSPGIDCENMCVLPPYIGNGSPPGKVGTKFVTSGYGPTSATANGTTLTITWPSHGFANGVGMRIQLASNTAMNTVGAVTVVDANTLSIPNGVSAGGSPYNSSNEANAVFSMDCNWPSNGYGAFKSIMNGIANPIAQIYRVFGNDYASGSLTSQTVPNWIGPNGIASGMITYNGVAPAQQYGPDGSVMGSLMSGYISGLLTRAYQTQPRSALYGVGYGGVSFGYRGIQFNPAIGKAQPLYDRPETVFTQMMGPTTWGLSSYLGYNYYISGAQDFNNGYSGANAISETIVPYQWIAQGHAFGFFKMLDRFLLGAPLNSPDFGPFFTTEAHCNMTSCGQSADVGNVLMSVCLTEMPGGYPTFTVDLSSINIAGGRMYKVVANPYKVTWSLMAGNPTSDTAYSGCGTVPGETTAWVAQPAAAIPLLTPTTFAPPATLPYGATKMLVRLGLTADYLEESGKTDCSSVCTVYVPSTVDSWYQILYKDSNGQQKGPNYPDVNKIAKVN